MKNRPPEHINIKRQHSLNRKTIITAGLLSCTLAVAAQDSLSVRDFRLIADADVWLTQQNAAGLTRYARRNLSQAEVYGSMSHGGFTSYSGSPHTLQGGAGSESFFRLSPRTVAYGRMQYHNFSGREMYGSAFIQQDRMPFNIVEDSLTNPGRKHMDTYRLTGAVGVDVWRGFAVGIKADYTAANYAKYKDLRHKNKLMDLNLALGIYAPLGRHIALGAHYFYHRNTESIKFSTYGKSDKSYKSLIDYGAFMGFTELYGAEGFTDKSREQPLVSNYNGAGAQLQWDITDGLAWFNGLTAARRKGYYGRKSPYTPIHTRHDSYTYTWQSRLQLTSRQSIHHIEATIDAENLTNRANHYRTEVNEQGARHYEYFDPIRTANKVWVSSRVAYTGWLGVEGDMARWQVNAAATFNHRRQTSYLHPYFRRQHIDNRELSAGARRNIVMRKGVLTLGAAFSFLRGQGSAADDGAMAQPSDKQSFPATMEAWLLREHRWLTAPQYRTECILRYAFMPPQTKLATWVEASVGTHKANGIGGTKYYAGCDNTTLSVSIGCLF